jgi:HAD superfamily hydrolase (TIGR01509 family)
MIRAAIFDMDGLLIDSEPLWTRAEIQAFATVGIELDREKCAQTVGMGLEEVVRFRYRQRPWEGKSLEEVGLLIHRRMLELVQAEGRPMPGALEAVEFFRSKGLRLGLATSSDRGLIDASLQALHLQDAFDHLQSGSELEHGKPHPLVYLTAAEKLSVPPAECLALEDSIPGLIAAKAARMKALAVPEPRLFGDPRFGIADLTLQSLKELDEAAWRRLDA